MMTVGDINNVTFEKALRGYRLEDVDDFLAKIALEFEALTNERDEALNERDVALAEREDALTAAAQEKEDSEKKLYILAEKIEQYRADEENLKVTLLNAQRMGDTVINEAKQKAETLVYEAKTRAAQVHEEMKTQLLAEEARLSTLRKDVSKFRAQVLELYQNHIEMVSSIPSHEEKKAASPSIAFSTVEAEVSAPAPKKAAKKEEPQAAPAPQQTAAVRHTAPQEVPEVEQPSFETQEAPIDSFENYQGISFDE